MNAYAERQGEMVAYSPGTGSGPNPYYLGYPVGTTAYTTNTANTVLTAEQFYGYYADFQQTATTINLPTTAYWQPIGFYEYSNFPPARAETEEERDQRERDSFYDRYARDAMIERDIFECWYAEARKQRLDALWQKEQAWRRWLAAGADVKQRVKAIANYGDPPYAGDQELQERGFARRMYGVSADGRRRRWEGRELPTPEQLVQLDYERIEVVWYRFEVPYESGVPRFVRMDGRPTRAERRAYNRVLARQEELRLAREEVARLAAIERERLQAQARERATALLVAHLNEVQQQEWAAHNYFHVHVSRNDGTGSTVSYRIEKRGQAGNVSRVENGTKTVSYCIHPYGGNEPDEDVYLMQKLLLETNEAEFLRIANATRVRYAA